MWVTAFSGMNPYEACKGEEAHIAMLLENSSRERYHEDVKFLQTIYDQV